MRRCLSFVLITLTLGLVLGACGSQRVWVAKPADGGGVKVELSSYDYENDDMNLLLRVQNKTNDTLVMALDQIRVVLPDGSELKQDGGKPYFTLWGGLSRYVRVKFESDDFDLTEAEGLWMRFDGAYLGDNRPPIPPMQIASPSHPAGTPKQYDVPQLARDEFAKGRERTGQTMTASISTGAVNPPPAGLAPAATPPPSGGGFETHQGQRAMIKATNTKVAAMPLKTANVSETVAFIIDDLLLTELQSVGFEAIGPEDINALIGFEAVKDQLACDEASCAAEIGNALGVPFLTAGNVANVDGTTVLTLKLINVRDTTVVARVSKLADGGPRIMPRVIAEAVQEMVQRSGL